MKTIVIESHTLDMYHDYGTCLVMVYGSANYRIGDKVSITLSEWDEATAAKKALQLEVALITTKKTESMEFQVLHLVKSLSSSSNRQTSNILKAAGYDLICN